METENLRTHCIRCGECCLKSSPTLQEEDIHLVTKDLIHTQDLYVIRTGELVRDTVNNQLKISDTEFIKVREKGTGKGCIHYDEENTGCKIYEHRPVQCVVQECWDNSEYIKTCNSPRLTRKAVIKDEIILGLIAQHGKKCNYRDLETLVKQIETKGPKAIEEILALLQFDHELRPFVSEKMGVALNDMDFLFGRPLTETIAMFGLLAKKEPDGSFFLTMAQD